MTATPLDTADGRTSPLHPVPGSVVIVGAGPAGLTAAYELGKRGATATVVESDDVVGGISRTVVRDGYRFDIGGHRFFTKVPEVEALWHEILPDDEFLLRERKSRIYYRGKFYDYPIRPLNALRNLGLVEAVRCVLSFLWVRVHPPKDTSTLEGYVAANYGWRLYEHFFKTYTEKVWAVPASKLSADWGAQRIKGMSLWSAVWEPIRARVAGRRTDRSKQITSLIDRFQYPKHGPGMMWERCHELVVQQGSTVIFGARVTKVLHSRGRATSVIVVDDDGRERELVADAVISSMPLPGLVRAMEPPAPAPVLEAASELTFRDFLSVALVVPEDKVAWTDNWIYIHAPEVKTMRVQNFGSWSPYLVKDGHNVLGLEYTVSEGDEWWAASDDELIEIGKAELESLGLMRTDDVIAGYVVRMPKAYPTYDEHYQANVATLRAWLDEHVPNVHPVGRNGMHKYNNQDHSMFTAMLTVDNLFGASHDIWDVNVEDEYHEAGSTQGGGTGRDAPVVPRLATPLRP
ncbi:MAG: NAD(P)/FAD-dependent oxidoreductase [Microthrixaceae bacterium]